MSYDASERSVPSHYAPEQLPGVIFEQYVRCFKPKCQCMSSDYRHGPYYYRVWREGDKVQKTYIKKKDLERVRAACAVYRLIKHSLKRPSFVWQPLADPNQSQGVEANISVVQEPGQATEELCRQARQLRRDAIELRRDAIELRRDAIELRWQARQLCAESEELRKRGVPLKDSDGL